MKVEHLGTGKHEEAGLAAAAVVHLHFSQHAAFAQEVGAAVEVVRDYFHGELLPSKIFVAIRQGRWLGKNFLETQIHTLLYNYII